MHETEIQAFAERYQDPALIDALGADPEAWTEDADGQILRHHSGVRIQAFSAKRWIVARPDDSCLTGDSGRVSQFKRPSSAIASAREAGWLETREEG